MTTKQVQLRRGSDDDHDSFTGAIGELTYVSDTKELRIHDASTAGGVKVITEGTGTTNISNDVAVNTDKMTVDSATGNTVVAGTLDVTGITSLTTDLTVNTDKMTVDGATGDTVVAGTLDVTGITSLTTDLTVNTDKMTVDGATGDTVVAGTLDVTGDTAVTGTLGVTGNTTLTAILLTEKSADPGDPTEGSTVIWMSDGTEAGDDGDIMVKITAGATTNTFTLVDFDA